MSKIHEMTVFLQYLIKNNGKIKCLSDDYSGNKFIELIYKNLNNIREFERPDMYIELNDKIIWIEHFQFSSFMARDRKKYIDTQIEHEKVFYKKYVIPHAKKGTRIIHGFNTKSLGTQGLVDAMKYTVEKHTKNIDVYDKNIMKIHGGIQIEGCFMIEFGVDKLYYNDRRINILQTINLINILKNTNIKYIISLEDNGIFIASKDYIIDNQYNELIDILGGGTKHIPSSHLYRNYIYRGV